MMEVEADLITKRKIFYKCPFCWTNKGKLKYYDSQYFKNGNIAPNRIPMMHSHGNDEQTIEGNWETTRGSHCERIEGNLIIHITDNTARQ